MDHSPCVLRYDASILVMQHYVPVVYISFGINTPTSSHRGLCTSGVLPVGLLVSLIQLKCLLAHPVVQIFPSHFKDLHIVVVIVQ